MVAVSQDELWGEIRETMRWRHINPGHNEVDSINRLLSRPPWAVEGGAGPRISRQSAYVFAETWDLSRFWQLILDNPSLGTDNDPFSAVGPIVVVRLDNAEYLVDGRRRINYWQRKQVVGPHRVLLVSEVAA